MKRLATIAMLALLSFSGLQAQNSRIEHRFQRGMKYVSEQKYDKAERMFSRMEESIVFHKRSFGAAGMGLTLSAQGRYDEAIPHFDNAVFYATNYDYPAMLLQRARNYIHSQNYKEAARDLVALLADTTCAETRQAAHSELVTSFTDHPDIPIKTLYMWRTYSKDTLWRNEMQRVQQAYELDIDTLLPRPATDSLIQEVDPEFPGGKEAFLNYMSERIVYPYIARFAGGEGTVIIGFVIKKDGKMSNITILQNVRGPGYDLGAEVLRALSVVPRWTPGQADGKPINTFYHQEIHFFLK